MHDAWWGLSAEQIRTSIAENDRNTPKYLRAFLLGTTNTAAVSGVAYATSADTERATYGTRLLIALPVENKIAKKRSVGCNEIAIFSSRVRRKAHMANRTRPGGLVCAWYRRDCHS